MILELIEALEQRNIRNAQTIYRDLERNLSTQISLIHPLNQERLENAVFYCFPELQEFANNISYMSKAEIILPLVLKKASMTMRPIDFAYSSIFVDDSKLKQITEPLTKEEEKFLDQLLN